MNNDYLLKIDELNVLVQTSYYTANKKNRVRKVADDLLSMLIFAYLWGIEKAQQMVGEGNKSDVPVSEKKMNDAIYRKIQGLTFEDRVRTHVNNGDLTRLLILAESEYHRVFNTAVADGVQEYIQNHPAIISGIGTKTWHTMRDDRVRDTHEYLEGITIPIDSEFYTYDGDHAPFPGAFEKADNNVNCRCYLTYDVM